MNTYQDIICKAVNMCYGVVGTSTPRGVTLISYVFPGLFVNDGVQIRKGQNGLIIDIYVIVEYGTNVKVIAQNLCDQVRFQLKEFRNVETENIYVHVKGVRKSGI